MAKASTVCTTIHGIDSLSTQQSPHKGLHRSQISSLDLRGTTCPKQTGLPPSGNKRSVKPQDSTPAKPAARGAPRQPVRNDISISDVPGLSDDRVFARSEKSFAQPDTMSPPGYQSEESEVAERIRLLELRLAESQMGGQQPGGFDPGYGRGNFGGGSEMRASGEGEKGAHKFMSGLATMHRGTGGANELQAAYEKKLQYQRELGEEAMIEDLKKVEGFLFEAISSPRSLLPLMKTTCFCFWEFEAAYSRYSRKMSRADA